MDPPLHNGPCSEECEWSCPSREEFIENDSGTDGEDVNIKDPATIKCLESDEEEQEEEEEEGYRDPCQLIKGGSRATLEASLDPWENPDFYKAPRPAPDLHTELPGYLEPGGSIAHKEEDRQEEVKLPQNSRDRTASVNSNGSTTDDSSEN